MAAEFLRTHGIDIDNIMSEIQGIDAKESQSISRSFPHQESYYISDVTLHGKPPSTTWDVNVHAGKITSIIPNNSSMESEQNQFREDRIISGRGALLAPSLCHPHIHLDKAYLLSHPRYADLQISRGDFTEAMKLTGAAKAQFEEHDLLERGQRLIDESVAAGVTHMRAFVEVDAGVGMKCLDAGIQLKRRAESEGLCIVQLCVFAQLPLFSPSEGDKDGAIIRGLMEQAVARPEVEVVGSTPYVERDRERMERNVDWMVELSGRLNVHLDFHLDYHLDIETEPLVWYVVESVKQHLWMDHTTNKTIVLGHCTRLTHFSPDEWRRLKDEIGSLPISFVGLPTSDLFMMRATGQPRGTLNVPQLIREYGLSTCLGINNIGNAFTPYGSCDPLTLACNGIGIYQAGTEAEAELLYQCVSSRAKEAIGLPTRGSEKEDQHSLEIQINDTADLVLFGSEKHSWRTRKRISEAVYLYDYCQGRRVFLQGRLSSR